MSMPSNTRLYTFKDVDRKSQQERINDSLAIRKSLKKIGFDSLALPHAQQFVADMNSYIRHGISYVRDVPLPEGYILSYSLLNKKGEENKVKIIRQ